MNIVAWLQPLHRELLNAGQERAASLILRIPELVHDGESGQVEALIPEAIALSRAFGNAWLEVYFRHWEMRNRLVNLGEGETALADAVGLLEFSHREEIVSCPQAVCATHDLSDCYSRIDGPGWARERRAVCEETLARLTPAWPCYTCLHREYVEALLDQKRFDAALERLDYLSETLREYGIPEDGRIEIDREDEAWEVFPRWGGILPGDYLAWAETALALARKDRGANTWGLCVCLRQAQHNRSRAGVHRECIEIGVIQARLAMDRGISWTARASLSLAERHLSRLRAALGAREHLEALRAELDAMPAPVPPVPPTELPGWLASRTKRDPEREVEWLLATLERSPRSVSLTLLAVDGMEACNSHEEAAALLRGILAPGGRDDRELLFRLVNMYFEMGQEQEALDAVSLFDAGNPGLAHWARAYIALRRERWTEVLAEAAKALTHRPEEPGLLRLIAIARKRLGDFAEAAGFWRRVVALGLSTGENVADDRRELLAAASAAENWEEVRSVCADMGIPLKPGAGPLEENWGWVRLRFFEEGGWREYLGIRTGPCTAQVVSIADPEDVQHVRDLVVFDPFPVEVPPEDEESWREYITPYAVAHGFRPAGYTAWICDGADPGGTVFEAFCRTLEAHGYAVRLRQREGYSVRNPDATVAPRSHAEPQRLPGIYFAVASPPDASARDAWALVKELTAFWPHPLSFRGLALAAGAATDIHDAVIERYGL